MDVQEIHNNKTLYKMFTNPYYLRIKKTKKQFWILRKKKYIVVVDSKEEMK